jgi:DNA polymerase-3 subunit beta
MIFHIKRKELLEQVRRAAKVAAPTGPVTALDGILIEASAKTGLIRLTATNLESSIRVTLHGIVKRSGETVINAKLLLDMLVKLPGDEVFTELNGNNTVTIKSEHSSFNISVLPADKFPRVEIPMPEETVAVSGLRSLIKATAFAAEQKKPGDAGRPDICCVRLSLSDDGIRAAACNGYCLAETSGDADAIGDVKLLIPVLTLKLFASISNDAEVYEFGVTGENDIKHACFFDGTLLFTTRVVKMDFIDVDSFFSGFVPEYSISLEAAAFVDAVKNVTTLTDSGGQLALSFTDGTISLRCETDDGNASVSVPVMNAPVTDCVYYYSAKQLLTCAETLHGNMTLELSDKGILVARYGKTRFLLLSEKPKVKKETPMPETVKPEKVLKTMKAA